MAPSLLYNIIILCNILCWCLLLLTDFLIKQIPLFAEYFIEQYYYYLIIVASCIDNDYYCTGYYCCRLIQILEHCNVHRTPLNNSLNHTNWIHTKYVLNLDLHAHGKVAHIVKSVLVKNLYQLSIYDMFHSLFPHFLYMYTWIVHNFAHF